MAKKKLKPLLPTLREKKRYLAFEVLSKDKIADFDTVSNAILHASAEFLGQLGVSKAGLLVLSDKWDKNSQRGIVRVSHNHVDSLKAALTMIGKINDNEAIVKSVGVSGILNKAEKRYLKIAG